MEYLYLKILSQAFFYVRIFNNFFRQTHLTVTQLK